MSNSVVFIAHGDITTDKIYDYQYNLIKQDGGGCNWNVLYHLASMGKTCYAIGTRGNDTEGALAIDSLQRVGINTDSVSLEDVQTSTYHIILPNALSGDNSITHSRYSPITKQLTVHFSNNLPVEPPIELQDKNIYIILERIRKVHLDFINNVKNKKVCLDIGSVNTLLEFDKNYILEFLSKVNLLLLNDEVAQTLFKKLEIQNETELFEMLNLDLLIKTAGRNPVTFLFHKDDQIHKVEKQPNIVREITDNTGAGDAFFAVFINAYSRYLSQNKPIDSDFIAKSFVLANAYSSEIVKILGSRGTTHTLEQWLETYKNYLRNNEFSIED